MLTKLLNFTKKRILLVGDVMLDEYWFGATERISPEAPVPIVSWEATDYRAGGAANVALNIAGLGCKVELLGIIGADPAGNTLQEILAKQPTLTSSLIIDNNYPTINKLRIISHDQQLFRIDREKFYGKELFLKLVELFNGMIQHGSYDLVVLSDYNKGTLRDPQALITAAKQLNIPVIVDPKQADPSIYKNATILTPNLQEFSRMVNINSYNNKINYPKEACAPQELAANGYKLIENLNLTALLITKGKQGLTLLTKDQQEHYFPAQCQEVFDVTGAGDTVTATLATCLAHDLPLATAAKFANFAAGIVVNKLGTSAISLTELAQKVETLDLNLDHNNPTDLQVTARPTDLELCLGIITSLELSPILQKLQALGEKIVLVNGCFDILHVGHIQYLTKARSLGDRLVVAVNDDRSIKILKGPKRPINTLAQRMEVLAGLRAVDWVVAFGDAEEIRPGNLIAQLTPNILVKSKEAFAQIADIPVYEGAKHVLDHGGKVVLLERPITPDCDLSSTKLIQSLQQPIS